MKKRAIRAAAVTSVGIAALALVGCSTEQDSAPTQAAVSAPTGAGEMTLDTIEQQFDVWLDTVAKGDPAAINALYREDAVLLPTLWPGVLNTSAERLAYFADFVAKGPSGTIDESVAQILSPTSGSLSGLYTFAMGESGESVPARFTFVFEREDDGDVVIVDHHSSKMPD